MRHEGRIWPGGVEKEVAFVDAADEVNDQVDAAYRAKYRRYAASIISGDPAIVKMLGGLGRTA